MRRSVPGTRRRDVYQEEGWKSAGETEGYGGVGWGNKETLGRNFGGWGGAKNLAGGQISLPIHSTGFLQNWDIFSGQKPDVSVS
jgi:hypothetical protein